MNSPDRKCIISDINFSQNHVLSDDQSSWIKKTTEKVYQLMKETPPDGEKYAEAIEVSLLFKIYNHIIA